MKIGSRPIAAPAVPSTPAAPAVLTPAEPPRARDASFSTGGSASPLPAQVSKGPPSLERSPMGAVKGLDKVAYPAFTAGMYACVDLGSSSVKMLVMRVEQDGAFKVVEDLRVGANLGKGVAADGTLPQANQDRVLDALATFTAAAQRHGIHPQDIPLIATAAVRNAPNGAAFMARIQGEAGLARARILNGQQEAETGYLAGIAGVPHSGPGNFATLDLGGGSFQLAVGNETTMDTGGSTQVGSNRVQEELLPVGIINADAYAKADAALAALAPLPIPVETLKRRTWAAVGGVSLFLKAQFGSDTVPLSAIDALRLQIGTLAPAQRAEALLANTPMERRKALGVDSPEGALDYATKLPAKLTLLVHIMKSAQLDTLHISSTDSRHVLALRDAQNA